MVQLVEHLLVFTSDDLDDLVDPVDLVAGIDALRAVAQAKVAAALQAGGFTQKPATGAANALNVA